MSNLTLEQIYYIGELLAAVGVVISILYLALQVKESRIVAHQNTLQRISASFNEVYTSFSDNPELAEIYRRFLVDMEALEETEKIQIVASMNRAMESLFEMEFYRRKGTVDDLTWDHFLARFIDAFQYNGFKQYWSLKQHWYDEGFCSLIEDITRQAEKAKPLYFVQGG